jgi:hypothetical protein
MRTNHVIAVAAILIVGLGVKKFWVPPTQVEADMHAMQSASMNIAQMHSDLNPKTLPVGKIHDMTFVFDSE